MDNHPDFPMWSAILRWSLANADDGTRQGDEQKAEMDPERMAFLKDFMKANSVDYAKRLCEVLKALSEGAEEGSEEESMMSLLRELEDMVECLDWARDMCKLGGVEVLFQVIESAKCTSLVKAQALATIAAAAQNDEPSQRGIIEKVGMARVVAGCEAALLEDTEGEWARCSFAALSALVRGNAALEEQCASSGTASRLLKEALSERFPPRLAAKAAFFLKALVLSDATDEARLVSLRPALQAALEMLDTMVQDKEQPATMQARDSATAAIVHSARNANFRNGFFGPNAVLISKVARDAQTKARTDEDFNDQAALWTRLGTQ